MCLFTIGCWMNTLGFLPKVIAHTCQRETLTTENTLKIYLSKLLKYLHKFIQ